MKVQPESPPPGINPRLVKPLYNPWVDRTIAIVATLPFIPMLVGPLASGQLDIPRLTLVIHVSVIVGTMLLRRAPVRVTTNPWFWLLTFIATYWGFVVAAFTQSGSTLLPSPVTSGLAIGSLLVHLYARFSLGRNIGFVPAQRRIVTGGAYRFVRHPIYTGGFINYGAVVLANYTAMNLLLIALGIGWMVVKSFIEESFLRQDPEYAAYMKSVRWRWIPGIV